MPNHCLLCFWPALPPSGVGVPFKLSTFPCQVRCGDLLGDITKLLASSSAAAVPKVNNSAAKAAPREEREASYWAKAEAKEAQKKANEVAAEEAADKAATKEAAKEEHKVRERSLAFCICYGAVDSFFSLIECDASSHAKNE
jgi:hypothetical protein